MPKGPHRQACIESKRAREPNTKRMITLRNVEKCFRTKAAFSYVLRQINLEIAEGEFLTVMGPSGAGKSTLLGILGMYDHAWEGEFYFTEHPVHRLPQKERSMLNKHFVGFVCSICSKI